MERLRRGHVLRIFVVCHIEETAFRTKTAMGAMGQIPFHFAFFSAQHLLDLFRIDGFCFLIRHTILRVAISLSLPGSRPLCETVLTSAEETIEEEKEHVPKFRKWDGNEHDFSR